MKIAQNIRKATAADAYRPTTDCVRPYECRSPHSCASIGTCADGLTPEQDRRTFGWGNWSGEYGANANPRPEWTKPGTKREKRGKLPKPDKEIPPGTNFLICPMPVLRQECRRRLQEIDSQCAQKVSSVGE